MIHLIPLADTFSIYQLSNNQEIPKEISTSNFYSITKTSDEISIVASCSLDFNSIKSNKYWKGFKVEGILYFSMVGILNDLTKPMKDNGISVFVLSTFNTDYIFVKEECFDRVIDIYRHVDNILIRGE